MASHDQPTLNHSRSTTLSMSSGGTFGVTLESLACRIIKTITISGSTVSTSAHTSSIYKVTEHNWEQLETLWKSVTSHIAGHTQILSLSGNNSAIAPPSSCTTEQFIDELSQFVRQICAVLVEYCLQSERTRLASASMEFISALSQTIVALCAHASMDMSTWDQIIGGVLRVCQKTKAVFVDRARNCLAHVALAAPQRLILTKLAEIMSTSQHRGVRHVCVETLFNLCKKDMTGMAQQSYPLLDDDQMGLMLRRILTGGLQDASVEVRTKSKAVLDLLLTLRPTLSSELLKKNTTNKPSTTTTQKSNLQGAHFHAPSVSKLSTGSSCILHNTRVINNNKVAAMTLSHAATMTAPSISAPRSNSMHTGVVMGPKRSSAMNKDSMIHATTASINSTPCSSMVAPRRALRVAPSLLGQSVHKVTTVSQTPIPKITLAPSQSVLETPTHKNPSKNQGQQWRELRALLTDYTGMNGGRLGIGCPSNSTTTIAATSSSTTVAVQQISSTKSASERHEILESLAQYIANGDEIGVLSSTPVQSSLVIRLIQVVQHGLSDANARIIQISCTLAGMMLNRGLLNWSCHTSAQPYLERLFFIILGLKQQTTRVQELQWGMLNQTGILEGQHLVDHVLNLFTAALLRPELIRARDTVFQLFERWIGLNRDLLISTFKCNPGLCRSIALKTSSLLSMTHASVEVGTTLALLLYVPMWEADQATYHALVNECVRNAEARDVLRIAIDEYLKELTPLHQQEPSLLLSIPSPILNPIIEDEDVKMMTASPRTPKTMTLTSILHLPIDSQLSIKQRILLAIKDIASTPKLPTHTTTFDVLNTPNVEHFVTAAKTVVATALIDNRPPMEKTWPGQRTPLQQSRQASFLNSGTVTSGTFKQRQIDLLTKSMAKMSPSKIDDTVSEDKLASPFVK